MRAWISFSRARSKGSPGYSRQERRDIETLAERARLVCDPHGRSRARLEGRGDFGWRCGECEFVPPSDGPLGPGRFRHKREKQRRAYRGDRASGETVCRRRSMASGAYDRPARARESALQIVRGIGEMI